MSDLIEKLMKQASNLDTDTTMPVALKLEKAKALEVDINEKSVSNVSTFKSLALGLEKFVKTEDHESLHNMTQLVDIFLL